MTTQEQGGAGAARIHTLANGVRLVTERMPGLRSAAIGIWIGAGARHEAATENGLAHFLEHMAFKGTTARTALRIAEEIENVGGYVNAYTSRETTAFHARCLGGDVAMVLDVLADIVLHPAFHPQDVENERDVILQEIGMTNDTPDDIIFDWLHEVSYPDQAFGRRILGTAERVARVTPGDLGLFIRHHYRPGRMIVSAAGEVDHDALVHQVETLFADLPAAPLPAVEPARFAGGERREIRPLEQAHFALNLEAPGRHDPDVYAARVWAVAMGGGMSSRLFQKIREEHGLCYAIHAQPAAYEDTGHVTIYAGTGEERIAELARLVVDELRRAPDDLAPEEVARARVQIIAALMMGLESSAVRAERNARLLAIWGRVPDADETAAHVRAVDVAAVRDWAGKALTARAALALCGPVGRAPGVEELIRGLAA